MAAGSFAGARPGYVFKKGANGLGYYRDTSKYASRPDKRTVTFGGNDAPSSTHAVNKDE